MSARSREEAGAESRALRRCKSWLKKAFVKAAPQTATQVMSARSRAYSQRLVQQWGLFQLNQKLIREVGNQVTSGPFQGMTLTPMTYREHIGPFLLGAYEMELHPWLDQVFQQSFAQIIVVGASFGYYAIGLARRFPQTPIVAFDTDPWARSAVRQMVRANRVDRMEIRGFCGLAWMKNSLRENALIISDCEGYERELFSLAEVPALASATMIIELHEEISPGISTDLASRFVHTHSVQQVGSRSMPYLPKIRLRSLTESELLRASNEVRPPQAWLFLRPKVLHTLTLA